MQEKIKPLKQFGQNYIQDKNIILKIINQIKPVRSDFFLEIGPGLGSLTSELVPRVDNFTAVEIDTRVIETLEQKFPGIKLINANFLEFDFNIPGYEELIRVAGNIPYNITSPILFKLIENRGRISDCHLMMQYEVAKRIVSKPGNKEYGILSVILNYFAETELCFKISPNVFFPKPKVDSAILRINFRKDLSTTPEFDNHFIKIVKASFANRRKTLKNSLTNGIFGNQNFSDIEKYLGLRAEQLTISDFIYISQILYKKE